MSEHFIKRTKTNTYGKEIDDNKEFYYIRVYSNAKERFWFKPMDKKDFKTKTAWRDKTGWQMFNCGSFNEAYLLADKKRGGERLKRKTENEQRIKAIKEKYNKLLLLKVIPANLENIRIILTVLNMQNWGGWVLPVLSIGYTVNQYDCDGIQATTIKLDKPVNGKTMYKVGGKFGHLNKYTAL